MNRDRRSRHTTATWESYREALRLFFHGVTVPTATRIALVVGTWLSLLNQGEAILDGRPPWVTVSLNYLTPFLVASAGYLAARRRRNLERLVALLDPERPGEAGGDGGRLT